jgi:hypothetical protein
MGHELGEWESGGTFVSSLEQMSMPTDENIDAPHPFVEIIATNPITKDLVVSKELG